MRKHVSAPGISVVVPVLACLIVSIIVTTYAQNQLTRNVIATNGQTTTTTTLRSHDGSITLGSPQFGYTE